MVIPDQVGELPEKVGIHGMELYFPKLYLEQSELEKYDGVGEGKYICGLGQEQMGFCADHEDITSICLTVVSKLLRNYALSVNDVGFLCVGTETITDKSKSVKTSLMSLFEGNCDIEGIDVKNACFGGTQALFHAIDWIYGNWEFEKKYAIVVMADIAVYSVGPARCTGGAGAFAALVGPNAVLSFDRGLRATHVFDVWDFYKPDQPIATEYPVVDGPLSLQAYFTCLDYTYELYCRKSEKLNNEEVILSNFDALFFHCPFSRLVRKAFGRLAYSDFKRGYVNHLDNPDKCQAANFTSLSREQTYVDRGFAQMTTLISESLWKTKTDPFLIFGRRVGNMYTASLYSQLVAFFHKSSSNAEVLDGHRLLFFSYGSGAAASMFSARISFHGDDAIHQYNLMKKSSDTATALLNERLCISPTRYNEILALREKLLTSSAPYVPEGVKSGMKDEFGLFPNTFFLECIDDKRRRRYSQVSS